MGNSGSAHSFDNTSGGGYGRNPNNGNLDLQAYYQQQQLQYLYANKPQQTHTADSAAAAQTRAVLEKESAVLRYRRQQRSANPQDWTTKSLPHITAASQQPQYKVLPQLDVRERLPLRATTNGCILNAGGTISGRKILDRAAESNKDTEKEPQRHSAAQPFQLQRSRTMICELELSPVQAPQITRPPVFKRAQTLLQLRAQRSNEHDDLRDMHQQVRNSWAPSAAPQTSFGSTSSTAPKNNKYQKKRKAPSAPIPAAVANLQRREQLDDNLATQLVAQTGREESLGKARLFRTHMKEPFPASQQEQQLHRHHILRKSMGHNNAGAQEQQRPHCMAATTEGSAVAKKPIPGSSTYNNSQLPYRREKSSDAILFGCNRPAQLAARTGKSTKQPCAADETADVAQPIAAASNRNKATVSACQMASKIPQLKRTFYFGMSSMPTKQQLSIEPTRVQAERHEIQAAEVVQDKQQEQPELEHPKLQDKVTEEIVDNGLLVQVRPSLPRRQLDTPSFSPTAAWRMLVEEQKNIQSLRHSLQGVSDNRNCKKDLNYRRQQQEKYQQQPTIEERPISLKSRVLSAKMRQHDPHDKQNTEKLLTWTPQQDLEEEDDGDNDGVAEDAYRAVEQQCNVSNDVDAYNAGAADENKSQIKKSQQNFNTANSSSSSTHRLHVFNLSLPRDAYMEEAHMKSLAFEMPAFNSLQKLKIHDRSDNWVLHKTKDLRSCHALNAAAKKVATDTLPYCSRTSNLSTLPSNIEPLSLISAGKHVMYLPGDTSSRKPVHTAVKTHQQQSVGKEPITDCDVAVPAVHQMARVQRENLQDEPLPVPSGSQYNLQLLAAQNDKSQRFSFQSTTRVLEKRRLAEKLAKKAQIQEAHRLGELEAMKRVEEDFQRKRASEKAILRNQLLLYFSSNTHASDAAEMKEQLHIMPDHHTINTDRHDSNNNITTQRTDPEGAAATPTNILKDQKQLLEYNTYQKQLQNSEPQKVIRRKTIRRYDSDCGESDNDGDNALLPKVVELWK